MIVHIDGEEYVEWQFQSAQGGKSILSIPLDVYLVFVQQACTLEQLRCLLFAWPQRKTANAKRKQAGKKNKALSAKA